MISGKPAIQREAGFRTAIQDRYLLQTVLRGCLPEKLPE